MANLSKASEYEQAFKTRHRFPGRPSADDPGTPESLLFPAANVHPVLARIAQRRAYALVHLEQQERLASIYRNELKVLERRGVEQVAADSNVTLEPAAASA